MPGNAMKAGADLILTKLEPPRYGGAIIARPRLIDQLLAGAHRRLTMIGAPAGYGKTALMVELYERLRAAGWRVAWLSLDEDQGDRGDFLNHILAIVARLTGSAELEAGQDYRDVFAGNSLLAAAIAELRAVPGEICFFLDDMHLVDTPACGALLDSILTRFPENCHFVLAGRRGAVPNLFAMLASGQAQLIGAAELALDLDEMRAILGPGPSAEELAALHLETEGWPTAVQLVRLQPREAGSQWRLPAGSQRGRIYDFMAEVLFKKLPADTRLFLMRLAILRTISATIAGKLTGEADAWAMLERLHEDGLFIFPVDAEHGIFRFHQLFVEFLRARAERDPAIDLQMLHAAAAEHFITAGDVREALYHARFLADWESVAAILGRIGGWRLCLQSGTGVWRDIERLDPRVIRHDPALQFIRVYQLMQTGRVEQARRLYESILPDVTATATNASAREMIQLDCQAMDLLISSYEDRSWTIERLQALEARLDAAPASDDRLAILVLDFLAWGYFHAGLFYEAIVCADRCIALCHARDIRFIGVYVALAGALARQCVGEDAEARDLLSLLLARTEREFARVGLDREISVFLGGVEALRGDRDACARRFHSVRETILSGDAWADLFVAFAQMGRWSLNGESGDAADEWLATLLRHPHARRWPRTQAQLRLARLDEALGQGRPLEACLPHATDIGAILEGEGDDHGQVWQVRVRGLLAGARLKLRGGDVEACRALLARLDPLLDFAPLADRAEAALLLALADARAGGGRDAVAEALADIETGGWTLIAERYAYELAVATPDDASSPLPPPPGPAMRLSPRESAILALLEQGCTSKEIANRLDISINTVLGYRRTLYRKLDVRTRSQAIALLKAG